MKSFWRRYATVWVALLILPVFACGNNGGESEGVSAPAPSSETTASTEATGGSKTDAGSTPRPGDIRWIAYEEGLSRAKSGGKKVFVNFYADWCRYCKQMEQTTFEDKRVVSYLNDHFVPIRINTDKKPKRATEFGVRGLPVSWFLTEEGERIGNQPGYLPADTLLSLLKFIHTDAYESMGFNEFLKRM
jgi:thiol:disulfide interchange protein